MQSPTFLWPPAFIPLIACSVGQAFNFNSLAIRIYRLHGQGEETLTIGASCTHSPPYLVVAVCHVWYLCNALWLHIRRCRTPTDSSWPSYAEYESGPCAKWVINKEMGLWYSGQYGLICVWIDGASILWSFLEFHYYHMPAWRQKSRWARKYDWQ